MTPCLLWTLMWESISLIKWLDLMEYWKKRFVMSWADMNAISVLNQRNCYLNMVGFTVMCSIYWKHWLQVHQDMWIYCHSTDLNYSFTPEANFLFLCTDSYPGDSWRELPAIRRWNSGLGGWSCFWSRILQKPPCKKRSLFRVYKHLCSRTK